METRANHIWVGLVTLLLLAGALGFFFWLARLSHANEKQFDIFFGQSVGGVANGSVVTYSGVPVGQVSSISIWQKDPEFVRVRITVSGDTPIVLGTTASISASFTGVSNISLSGGRANKPPITCETTACPEGKPVIPPEPGVMGELLASAPVLLERLATLSERLMRLVDDDNQASIEGILRNTNAISGEVAGAAPELRETLVDLQAMLEQSTATLAAFEGTVQSADGLLAREGPVIAADLRITLGAARSAAEALERTLGDVAPLTQQLQHSTLPNAHATLRDLRQTSQTLRTITERIESEGAVSLIQSTPLPEYRP